MEFAALSKSEFYEDCERVAQPLGFVVVELRVNKIKTHQRVDMVIARSPESGDDSPVGIDDCAKIHRILLQKFEVLLNDDDIYMEVSSPGAERNIKNAAEFAIFVGKEVRLWLEGASEWLRGKIAASDGGAVEVEIDGEREKIAFSQIIKAKLCG